MENATVLIADDNETMRRLLARSLSGPQTQILTAADGFSALQLARSARPDLLVLDVRMPVMGGFEVLEALRRDDQTRGIPVLVLTGAGRSSDEIKALEGGADDYVAKPFDLNVLVARAGALVRRGQALPAAA